VSWLADDSFPFDLRVVSKVDQQTQFVTGCFEVVMNLCAMLVGELRDGSNEFKRQRVLR